MTTMTTPPTSLDATKTLPAPEARRGAHEPDWLGERRRAAAERFNELGLPGPKVESWRQTNLRPLRETTFAAPASGPGGAAPRVDADALRARLLADLDGPRLVFVNGFRSEALSDLTRLPDGVTVMSLARAIEERGDLLRDRLGRLARIQEEAFTAYNAASFADGVFVHVAEGVTFDRPIHVVSLTTTDEPIVTNPRNLIAVEPGASVTVVEEYVADDPRSVYLTNAMTEVFVGEGASATHYLLERESEAAFHVSTLAARQETGSRFTSHSALLGGRIVRNNVQPTLEGESCLSVLNGLYVGRGEQVLDNAMRVEHAKPNCNSRQYYRGILGERSQGLFGGRIVVARDAQKTDAVQSNQNLLLSGDARAHAKPQLEIYADDVKCTHGATIGELDEDAIFYLRSRGLSPAAARGMLIHAFAGESLDRMDLDAVREAITAILPERIALPTA